ncbi:MAG: hypothetical protein ACQEQX_03610 [Thermodesulfobacteriota bacterium]
MTLPLNNCLLALAICLCLALCSAPAQAHRVNLYCSLQQKEILCEASFADGSPVSGADIVVQDTEGQEELLSTETDRQGQASFALPEKTLQSGADLEVTLQASMGHQDSWTIPAKEYAHLEQPGEEGLDATPGNRQESQEPSSKADSQPSQEESSRDWPSRQELRDIVAEELAQELEPLQKKLRSRDKVSLQDVLAGLGYILGLAGIAFYFKGRKGQ